MSNINRRDYLKGMAASAAVIAASKLDVSGQHQGRNAKHKKARTAERTSAISQTNWLITPDKPSPDAFVTAIFSGLMGFSYDSGYDVGRVGFHGHSGHNLSVEIYSYPGCMLLPSAKQPKVKASTKLIKLKVPQSKKHVEYFEKDADQPFNRTNGDENDFRWLPDLDSDDFYPEGYDKNGDHFKTWLQVSNATFYTRLRTNSTFDLVDSFENVIKFYGNVAYVMAAAMDLSAGGDSVSLQVDDDDPLILSRADNVKYQIVFRNECSSCPEPNICSSDETKRNDFHFARKVLKLPLLKKRIGLKIHEVRKAATGTNICGVPELVTKTIASRTADPCHTNRNTDEAPCMGAGYGHDRL